MQKKTKYFPPKNLNLFFLSMFNIALIGGIKSWSLIGGFGLLSIAFYVLAVLLFLLPASLVSAELGSSLPKEGGIYLWIKEAFGHRLGFLIIWIYWIEIMLWVPIPLVKMAYLFAFALHPALANNQFFQLVFVLLILWGGMFCIMYGMNLFRWISSFVVLIGIILPGLILFVLALIHFYSGKGAAQSFSFDVLWTNIGELKNWVLFAGILFSIEGIEASAVHIPNLKNPQKYYPRAIFFSLLFLFVFYLLGALSMEIIFPKEMTLMFAGSMQDILTFLDSFQLKTLFIIMIFFLSIGMFAGIINWLVIPVRGLLALAKAGDLPPVFHHRNEYGMPSTLLVLQTVIVSVITILFILFPNVTITYWIFLAMASILYLIVYMFIFAAAIKLRYKKPDLPRPFAISKGNLGIWIVAGTGFCTSLVVFFFSFLVPEQTIQFSSITYFPWFALGLVLIFLGPSIILLFKKPNWHQNIIEDDSMPKTNLDIRK